MENARDGVDRLVIANLDDGIPDEVGVGYDVAVAGDVLEHLRAPERILEELHTVLRPGGSVVLSVPNFSHWYPRIRVLFGQFDYDNRGILDRGHIRFFTRRSVNRMLRETGWSVTRQSYVGLPFDVLSEGAESGLRRALRRIDRLGVRIWPTLFAYQFVLEAHATPIVGSTRPSPS